MEEILVIKFYFVNVKKILERSLLPVNYVKENSKNLTKQLVEIFENAKGIYSTGIELTIINNLEWYEKVFLNGIILVLVKI